MFFLGFLFLLPRLEVLRVDEYFADASSSSSRRIRNSLETCSRRVRTSVEKEELCIVTSCTKERKSEKTKSSTIVFPGHLLYHVRSVVLYYRESKEEEKFLYALASATIRRRLVSRSRIGVDRIRLEPPPSSSVV